MRKTVIKFGLISGAILVVMMLITMPMHDTLDKMNIAMLVGYATMLIALSTVFIGIRSYRDRELGGSISFGKAFQIGILITLIASVIYVVGWNIYSSIAMPDFMERYTAHAIEGLKKSGASAEEIAKQTKTMNEWAEMYKNPVIGFFMVFIEIFPVGLVITLISALLLRTKKANTLQTQAA